jgi:hypothetical protein
MKLRTLFAGAGLCVLAIVSLEAADRYAFREAVAAFASRADGLTFERIVDEPLRGEARIVGLNWRRDDVLIHIGALTFAAPPFLPPVAAAVAGTGSATVEDLTIEAGPSTYKIKRVDLVGASLSASELRESFDPKQAETLVERLAKLSATTITMPELTIVTRIGATTQQFFYRDIALNGVVSGKAATASAAGASFTLSDPRAGDAAGAYGRISASNVDLVLAAKLLTQTIDNPDAPKLPLYQSVSVDGFHLGNAHFGLDIKTLTAAAVKARPPQAPLQPTHSEPVSPETSKSDALRWLDSFEIEDAAATDIRLDLNKDGDAARLTIARGSLPRLDGAKIDAIDGQDLALQRKSGMINLARSSFRGLDLWPMTSADRAPNKLARDFRPDFEQIVLTKLVSNPASTGEEAAKAGAFELGRFEIDSAAQKEPAGRTLNVAVDHFIYLLDDDGAFRTLADMGYSRLDLSSRLNMIWTEASSELAIDDFSIEGADMGSVDITASIANVTEDLVSGDERIAAAAVRDLLIKKLDIHIVNGGLFDKALAAQAKSQKQSVDEARQSDMTKATLVLPALLGNKPPIRVIGSELAKFVADPKTFSLVILAPDGFGVADLELARTPEALLKKIEITAYANQR